MTTDTKVNEFIVNIAQEEAYRFGVSFEGKSFAPLALDEPPPLGRDTGPNASRLLAAAIGNCLAASFVFCLSKRGVTIEHGVEARVSKEIVRTVERRPRVGRVKVDVEIAGGAP